MRLKVHALRVMGIVHDLAIALTAFVLANILAHDFASFFAIPGIAEKTAAFVAISGVCLYGSGLNRGSWRYASIPDLVAILQATTAAVVIFTIANFMISRAENISRSAVVITWLLMVFGLGGPRLVYRLLKEHFSLFRRLSEGTVGKHVLLYPYSDFTENYIRAVRRSNTPNVIVAGIVDPRPSHRRRVVQGRSVLGTVGEISTVVASLRKKGISIKELIITDPSVTGSPLMSILGECNNAGIGISRLPNILDTKHQGSGATVEPKPIRLEDLLGRAEIQVDSIKIARIIKSKVVLVTGAGGSIGSELCRQIASFEPSKLILVELGELNLYRIEAELIEKFPELKLEAYIADVRDRQRINSLFEQMAPDAVFHAAALKHVPLVEGNPLEAIKTNMLGSVNVADASLANGVEIFVQISTDKAVNPTNVMGATKRAAEAYCQTLDMTRQKTRFRTVRFGNVLGSSGSVVPRFEEQIAKGGPVTVTHPNITRYFMTIPEAVRLVLQASAQGIRSDQHRGKILVLDMGEPVKIMDLAKRMIQLAGYKVNSDIKIEVTGLRPGEKLFEELLSTDERTLDSAEKGFIAASAQVLDHSSIERSITETRAAVQNENVARALAALRQIVPTYKATPTEKSNDSEEAVVIPLPSKAV